MRSTGHKRDAHFLFGFALRTGNFRARNGYL
jgi:hypothetical protein